MFALAIVTAALVAAAAAVGAALRAGAAGPVVGLAALVLLARWGTELPGRATTAAALVGAAAAVGVVAAVARRRRPGVEPVVAAGLALLAGLVPFLVAGEAGIIGMGDNNDMSAHLTAAWWLDTHGTPQPMAARGGSLVTQGYPFGPHALAAALSRATGVSLVQAFDAVTIVGPIVAAIALLGILPATARRPARVAGAVLAALAYLPASFLAQGAFKEVLLGALLTATAVALRELRGARAAVALGVLGAAALYVYSAPGVLWPGIAVLLCLVARRGTWRAALGAVAVGAMLAAPEAGHVHAFLSSSFAGEPLEGLGNLAHPLAPAEAAGIWLRGDFRFNPHPYALTLALDGAVLLAVVAALRWWWRRREPAAVAALAAAAAMALQSWQLRSPYNTGKGLAILGAAVALVLAPPLVGATRRWAAPALLLALAAAASSFAALRHAPVGSTREADELQRLARTIGGRAPVLYLGVDDFAQWQMRGTAVSTGPLLYSPRVAQPSPHKPWLVGQPFDVDLFSSPRLDGFAYLITTTAAYGSSLPPSFRAVARTADFVLWRRIAATPQRIPIEAVTRIGRRLRCPTTHAGTGAVLLPAPIVRNRRAWRGFPDHAGARATLTLRVPAGDWDVSLQYVGATGFDLRAPGLRATLPQRLSRIGAYWPAGRLTVRRATRVTFVATARQPSGFGRLLGAPARTRALNVYTHKPLGGLALTRHAATPRTVPLPAACGRFVDHVLRGGAASASTPPRSRG